MGLRGIYASADKLVTNPWHRRNRRAPVSAGGSISYQYARR